MALYLAHSAFASSRIYVFPETTENDQTAVADRSFGLPQNVNHNGVTVSITNPQAVAIDGNDLYIADRTGREIFVVPADTADGATASITRRFVLPADISNPHGLAIDGNDLFAVDVNDDSVYIVNADTADNTTATIQRIINLPQNVNHNGVTVSINDPLGLAIDGNDLYIANAVPGVNLQQSTSAIFIIPANTADGAIASITRRISVAGRIRNTDGIAIDGNDLYIANNSANAIYNIAADTADNTIATIIKQFGTPTGASVPLGLTFASDQATLTLTVPTLYATVPANIAVTFSETVTGLVQGDFNVTGATVTGLTGSGTTYTLSITPATDAGTVTIALPEDSVTPSNAAFSQDYTRNAVPTIAITFDDSEGESGGTTGVKIVASAAITGLALGDFTVTNGTLSNLQGSGTSYTADLAFPATGDGTTTLTLPANAVSPGNAAVTATIDYVEPLTGSFTSYPTTVVSPDFHIIVEFSRAIDPSTLVATDLRFRSQLGQFNNPQADDVDFYTDDNITFLIVMHMADRVQSSTLQYIVRLPMNRLEYQDDHGNTQTGPESTLNTPQFGIDPDRSITPTITYSESTGEVGTPLTATTTFNQPVSGVGISDFSVVDGTLGSAVTVVSSSEYTVQVTPTAGDGTLTLTFAEDGTYEGNAEGAADLAYTGGVSPATPSITYNPTSVRNGRVTTATIQWDMNVTGFAIGDLSVNVGALSNFTAVDADTYTVDITAPTTGSGNITLTIAEDAVDETNSEATATVAYSALPTVTIAFNPLSVGLNETSQATITWSESVTEFVIGDLSVDVGSLSNFSGSGTTYTVDVTSPSTGSGNVTLTIAEDAVSVGNAETTATLAYAPPLALGWIVPTSDVGNTFSVTLTSNYALTGVALTDFRLIARNPTNFIFLQTSDPDIDSVTLTQISGTHNYRIDIVLSGTYDQPFEIRLINNQALFGSMTVPTANLNSSQWNVDSSIVPVTPATPTVTFSPTSVRNGRTTEATIQWDMGVTGFTIADLSVDVGSLSNFTAVDADTFTVDITAPATGSGDITLTIAEDAVDETNSEATATVAYSALPTVTIAFNPSSVGLSETSQATITWSESVTGFTIADLSVDVGSLSNFSGSGTTYTVDVTSPSTGSGNVTLTLAEDAVSVGNAEMTGTIAYAEAVPDSAILIITTTDTDIRAGEAVDFTITSDIAITGFTAPDITVTGGTRGALTANSATSYTLRVTAGSGAGSIVISIPEDVVSPGNAAASQTFTRNALATVAITTTDTDIIEGEVVNFDIVFSEAVTGFTASDVSITGGTRGALTGSGSNYDLSVTAASGAGNIVLSITANVVSPGNAAVSATFMRTVLPPSAATATVTTPTTIQSRQTQTVTITWDQSVSGFAINDLSLNRGTLSNFTGSGDSYTVDIQAPYTGSDLILTLRTNAVSQGNAQVRESIGFTPTTEEGLFVLDQNQLNVSFIPGNFLQGQPLSADQITSFNFLPELENPTSTAIDADGNLYVAMRDTSDSTYKIYVVPTSTTAVGAGYIQKTIRLPSPIENPQGLAIDTNGNRIYIADNTQNTIYVVEPSDSDNAIANLLRTIELPDEIPTPAGLSLDSNQNLYIANAGFEGQPAFGQPAIFIIDANTADGTTATIIKTIITPTDSPNAVAVDGNDIYFTYGLGSNIYVIPTNTVDGEIATTTKIIYTPNTIGTPVGVSLGADDNLYLADSVDADIYAIPASTPHNTTAVIQRTFYLSRFIDAPSGVTLDSNGNLFVLEERTNDNNEIFVVSSAIDDSGYAYLRRMFLMPRPIGMGGDLGSGITIDDSDNLYVLNRFVVNGVSRRGITIVDANTADGNTATIIRQFTIPRDGIANILLGITIDGSGNLYIIRVDGVRLFSANTPNNTEAVLIKSISVNALIDPGGIAVDADDNLYLADSASGEGGGSANIKIIDADTPNNTEADIIRTLDLSTEIEEPEGLAFQVGLPPPRITTDATNIRGGNTVDFDIVFPESVTNFTASDIIVTGGTANTLTGSGTDYVLNVTTDAGAGEIEISIPADVVSPGNFASSATFERLASAVVTLTWQTKNVRAGGSAILDITFSENVTGLTASDFSVNVGTLGALAGADDTYTLTVTAPTSNSGNMVVTLAANSINENNAETSASIFYFEGALAGIYVLESDAVKVIPDYIRSGQTLTEADITTFNFTTDPDDPQGITIGNNLIYVLNADDSSRSVIVYSAEISDGENLVVQKTILLPNTIDNPTGLTIDDSGNLFITSDTNDAVYRIDAGTQNNQTATVDHTLNLPNSIDNPQAIAIDANQMLYIADSALGANDQIVVVNANTPDGTIATIQKTIEEPPPVGNPPVGIGTIRGLAIDGELLHIGSVWGRTDVDDGIFTTFVDTPNDTEAVIAQTIAFPPDTLDIDPLGLAFQPPPTITTPVALDITTPYPTRYVVDIGIDDLIRVINPIDDPPDLNDIPIYLKWNQDITGFNEFDIVVYNGELVSLEQINAREFKAIVRPPETGSGSILLRVRLNAVDQGNNQQDVVLRYTDRVESALLFNAQTSLPTIQSGDSRFPIPIHIEGDRIYMFAAIGTQVPYTVKIFAVDHQGNRVSGDIDIDFTDGTRLGFVSLINNVWVAKEAKEAPLDYLYRNDRSGWQRFAYVDDFGFDAGDIPMNPGSVGLNRWGLFFPVEDGEAPLLASNFNIMEQTVTGGTPSVLEITRFLMATALSWEGAKVLGERVYRQTYEPQSFASLLPIRVMRAIRDTAGEEIRTERLGPLERDLTRLQTRMAVYGNWMYYSNAVRNIYRFDLRPYRKPAVRPEIQPQFVTEGESLDLNIFVDGAVVIDFEFGFDAPPYLSIDSNLNLSVADGVITDDTTVLVKLSTFSLRAQTDFEFYLVIAKKKTPVAKDIDILPLDNDETYNLLRLFTDADSVDWRSGFTAPPGYTIANSRLTITGQTSEALTEIQLTGTNTHGDTNLTTDVHPRVPQAIVSSDNFAFRFLIAGIDVSEDLLLIPSTRHSLDVLRPNQFVSDSASFVLSNSGGRYDGRVSGNFWGANSLNTNGYLESVELWVDISDTGSVQSKMLFDGIITRIPSNINAISATLNCVDRTYLLKNATLPEVGLEKVAHLAKVSETYQGEYKPDDTLLPILPMTAAVVDANSTLLPISAYKHAPSAVIPTTPEAYIDDSRVFTSGGYLDDDPLLRFQTPYRSREIGYLIQELSEAAGYFNPLVDIATAEPSAENHTLSRGNIAFNVEGTKIVRTTVDWVHDATNNVRYSLLSHPSAYIQDMLVSCDVDSDTYEILRMFDYGIQAMQLTTADFDTFYIIATTATEFDPVESPDPPNYNAAVFDKLDSSRETEDTRILRYTHSTNAITNFVDIDDDYPVQVGNHYMAGFENERHIRWREGVFAEARSTFRIHNGNLYYRYANWDNFGVARATPAGVTTALISTNSDIFFNTLNFDFDIAANGDVYMPYAQGTQGSSLLRIQLYDESAGTQRTIFTDVGNWYLGCHEVLLDSGHLYFVAPIGRGRDIKKSAKAVLYDYDISGNTLSVLSTYDYVQLSCRSLTAHDGTVYFAEYPNASTHFEPSNPDLDGWDAETRANTVESNKVWLKRINAGVVEDVASPWFDGANFNATAVKMISAPDGLHAIVRYADAFDISAVDSDASRPENEQWVTFGNEITYHVESVPPGSFYDAMTTFATISNSRLEVAANRLRFVDIDPYQALLDGGITDASASLMYDGANKPFPASGHVLIGSEILRYTGRTATQLTGLTRGVGGTTAAAHADNDSVLFLDKVINRGIDTPYSAVSIDNDTDKFYNVVRDSDDFTEVADQASVDLYGRREFVNNLPLSVNQIAWRRYLNTKTLGRLKDVKSVVSATLPASYYLDIGDIIYFDYEDEISIPIEIIDIRHTQRIRNEQTITEAEITGQEVK